MYDETLRIPLLIKYPQSKKTGNIKKMVSLTDLYPTILSLCGVDVPEGVVRNPVDNSSLPFVSEYYEDMFGEHRVLYEGDYKYLQFSKNRKSELYNLKNDPHENNNLSTQQTDVALQMEKKLENWKRKYTPKEKKQKVISDEVNEALKTLGYVQ